MSSPDFPAFSVIYLYLSYFILYFYLINRNKQLKTAFNRRFL
nr:MAG TPA: hypothetical protein [Caudoviricetes sp.]